MGIMPSGDPRLAPLGVPVVPRGEHGEAGLDARRLGVVVRVVRDQVLDARISPAPMDDEARHPPEAVEKLAELLVIENRAHVFAAADLAELRRPEHGVHQHHVRANLAACEERFDEAAMVATHDADHVAGRHTRFAKPSGERVRAAVDLVEGCRAFVVDDRDGVRLPDGERDETHCRRAAPTLGRSNHPNRLVGAHRFEDARPVQYLGNL